ncbi:hypothetical protein ELI02_02215 [Rhizobium leguminosarum]|uniref:hypothetical protein n=1 Tax=Rhizobium leguminosarum TaxID=384 RepID=UPI00103023CE|nr:hypothetical protein [Rhizobium leguminosarum]TAX58933.1 hypothetical protein ELI02_02215 [Rhizobium leguminosarum]
MSELSATTAFKEFDVAEPVEGAWLLSPLEELIPTGEYEGVTVVAADAILLIADDIEKHGVAPGGQKALADLLRYLATFALRPSEAT